VSCFVGWPTTRQAGQPNPEPYVHAWPFWAQRMVRRGQLFMKLQLALSSGPAPLPDFAAPLIPQGLRTAKGRKAAMGGNAGEWVVAAPQRGGSCRR